MRLTIAVLFILGRPALSQILPPPIDGIANPGSMDREGCTDKDDDTGDAGDTGIDPEGDTGI